MIYQKQLEEKVGLAQQENEQKFKQERNRKILKANNSQKYWDVRSKKNFNF